MNYLRPGKNETLHELRPSAKTETNEYNKLGTDDSNKYVPRTWVNRGIEN